MKKTSLFLALALAASGIFGSTVCSTANDKNKQVDQKTTLLIAYINPYYFKNASLEDALVELSSERYAVDAWEIQTPTETEFDNLCSQYLSSNFENYKNFRALTKSDIGIAIIF